MFCLTEANVDDRDSKVWAVLGKRIYAKLFADKGYISPNLFDALFADGVQLFLHPELQPLGGYT